MLEVSRRRAYIAGSQIPGVSYLMLYFATGSLKPLGVVVFPIPDFSSFFPFPDVGLLRLFYLFAVYYKYESYRLHMKFFVASG